jgi:hypothetical protein
MNSLVSDPPAILINQEPADALMGVPGHIFGIYGGLLCAWLLSVVAATAGD